MEDLSQEQQNTLQQFKEFTDFNEDEESLKVKRLLTVCNWNLEIAVARYFDNDFPSLFDESEIVQAEHANRREIPVASSPLPSSNNYEFPMMVDHPFMDLMPKLPKAVPIANKWKFQAGLSTHNIKKNRLITPIVFIFMLFPKLLWVLGLGLEKLFGNFAPKLFRILGLREGQNDFPSEPIYKLKEDIENYNIKSFIEDTIGEPTDLNIFKGTFNDAFNKAKNELKWLMCILINSKSDLSIRFIKDFMNNQHFITLIKKYNVILYVGDVSYPEPFEVGETYSSYALPYLNLIGNVSATGTTFPLMSIVCKHQSLTEFVPKDGAKKISKRLTRIIEKYEPQLLVQRVDKEEAELSRLIRQQQDEAYQESLLKDIKRQQEKKQLEEEEKKQLIALEEEKKLYELKLKRRKEFIIKHIVDNFSRDDSHWLKGEYTTIQFRNDAGQRIIRKFRKDENCMDIFMFVECKSYLSELANDEGKNELEILKDLKNYKFELTIENFENFEMEFKFDLVSPMPRMKLSPNLTNLQEIKQLWPNGSLLIEKYGEEYGDSDDNDDDDGDNK